VSLKCEKALLGDVNLLYQLLSENHRITQCSGLEGTSVGHLVQLPCRSREFWCKLVFKVKLCCDSLVSNWFWRLLPLEEFSLGGGRGWVILLKMCLWQRNPFPLL